MENTFEGITEVTEFVGVELTNKALKDGWILLGVFNEVETYSSPTSDSAPEVDSKIVYVVGKR